MTAVNKPKPFVVHLDKALPSSLTVKRQQLVYWPSILLATAKKDFNGSVVVNGFPSSGTNWLCNLISLYMDIPVLEVWLRFTPTLKPKVFHMHKFITHPNAANRTVYIHRDGRDAVLSQYHKLKPNPVDERPFREFEAYAGFEHDKSKIEEQLPVFIEWYFTAEKYSMSNWGDHVRKAISTGFITLSFEGLKQDAVKELIPVFEVLTKNEIDIQKLKTVVESMEFSKVKTKETSHHMRKGLVGEWEKVFTPSARATFAKHAQKELEVLGYEKDSSWVSAR